MDIGADLEALHQGTRKAQLRATAKQEIVDEIKEKTHEHADINVLAKKALLSYVGKLSHLAGIVEFLRPFMSDLYGVIHRTTGARAPNNCYWTKQWRRVTMWLLAFFQREKDTILRTYRVDSYFGKGLQVTIVTDASPCGSGGYMTISNSVIAYFADALTLEDEELLQMKLGMSASQQVAEALAILVALKLWADYWKRPGISLRIRGGNVGVLTLLMKMRPTYKSWGQTMIARELALEFGCSSYKPRSSNTSLEWQTIGQMHSVDCASPTRRSTFPLA